MTNKTKAIIATFALCLTLVLSNTCEYNPSEIPTPPPVSAVDENEKYEKLVTSLVGSRVKFYLKDSGNYHKYVIVNNISYNSGEIEYEAMACKSLFEEHYIIKGKLHFDDDNRNNLTYEDLFKFYSNNILNSYVVIESFDVSNEMY